MFLYATYSIKFEILSIVVWELFSSVPVKGADNLVKIIALKAEKGIKDKIAALVSNKISEKFTERFEEEIKNTMKKFL